MIELALKLKRRQEKEEKSKQNSARIDTIVLGLVKKVNRIYMYVDSIIKSCMHASGFSYRWRCFIASIHITGYLFHIVPMMQHHPTFFSLVRARHSSRQYINRYDRRRLHNNTDDDCQYECCNDDDEYKSCRRNVQLRPYKAPKSVESENSHTRATEEIDNYSYQYNSYYVEATT